MKARGKSTDGLVSRYLNRRVSTLISNYILSRGCKPSPNKLTIIFFLFSLLAPAFYIYGHARIAGVIVQASSILDGVDGEIARATGACSRRGAFLDSMIDRFTNILFITSASVYLLQYSSMDPLVVLVASLSCLAGDILVSYIHSKAKETLGVHPALVGSFPYIASRDVRLFILFIASVANEVLAGLVVIAVLSIVYTIAKTIECFTTVGRS